jgi:hypothetical protein
MPEPLQRQPSRDAGFSFVEMTIVVVFMAILMAGMAGMFRASLATAIRTGERISSLRRNRSAADMLYEDLNLAGLFLGDLTNAPSGLSAGNPPFYILPNQAISGATSDGPATADQLFFYFDQPLGFQGRLKVGSGTTTARNAATLVATGAQASTSDGVYVVDCQDSSYAGQVAAGQYLVFTDAYEALYISAVSVSGSVVTVTTGSDASASVTGTGSSGTASRSSHLDSSGVIFYQPAQMVRYSVQMLTLDPRSSSGVPCLVRDQGTYSASGFTADSTRQQVITEQVAGFKVYLSVDAGKDWAGLDITSTGLTFATGWTSGIQAELNTQLATLSRAGYTTTSSSLTWFRSIPTLVRLDLTTRTAVKRDDPASTTATGPVYKTVTQTTVLVPRHFGLALS